MTRPMIFACLIAGLFLPVALSAAQCQAPAVDARDGGAVVDQSRWVTQVVVAPNLHQRIFRSAAVGAAVSYHVLLPPGYDADPTRRFPVLYWLHGTGGGLARLATNAARFDAAMRAGDMPPMLVVYPYGLPSGMWVDSKDGSTPVESMLVKELIPHVDACHRTIAIREGRLLEGYSMGGYGAARIGLRHPQLFAAVLMVAAGPLQQELRVTPRASDAERARLMKHVYGDDMGYFREQSPYVQAEHAANSRVSLPRLRQIVGTSDETYPANREFHEHLQRLGIAHDYVEIPGVGHSLPALWSALGEQAWTFYGETARTTP